MERSNSSQERESTSKAAPSPARWKSWSDALIRYSIHLTPTEVQRTFAVTLLVGASCGVLAVLFHIAIEWLSRHFIERAEGASGPWWVGLTVLSPALGGLLAGWVMIRFPHVRGSGIPHVKAAYAVQTARLRLRDAIAKFALTTLQLGSGASLGREGPTVQICATWAAALGRGFALAPRSVRRLLPVGAAAGVAAAFNAPIAAVTFTVEEVVGGLDQTVLSGVVVAAALAAVIEHSILGEHPVLSAAPAGSITQPGSLLFCALLGLVAAVVSVGFTRGLLRLRLGFRGYKVLPAWAAPAVGGLGTGACAALGLYLVGTGGIAGGGYAELNQALHGAYAVKTLLVLGALKFLATLLSYASGGSGGLFAPSLFIGAMLGGVVGWVDQLSFGHDSLGAFALVGMGASFAGIVRAPMTSVLIIFEMTGGYGLVLPLMIANSVSYAVARRLEPNGLYEALLEQDGIRLVHGTAASNALEGLQVSDAMKRKLHSLRAERPVGDALKEMEGDVYPVYPVVDATGRCLGLVNRARVRRALARGDEPKLLAEMVRLKEYLYEDDPLIRAVVRMNAVGTRQLPVVTAGDQLLVGLITMSDIFRAQALAAHPDADPGERPHPTPAPPSSSSSSESQPHRAISGTP